MCSNHVRSINWKAKAVVFSKFSTWPTHFIDVFYTRECSTSPQDRQAAVEEFEDSWHEITFHCFPGWFKFVRNQRLGLWARLD
jgi:hypothetical protein